MASTFAHFLGKSQEAQRIVVKGPLNILTYDLPDLFFLQIEYLVKSACKSDFLSLSHMTVNSFLFCVLAVDQSNAAPRRRLAIKA